MSKVSRIPVAAVAAGLSCAWLAYSAAGQDAHWFSEHANKEGYYEGLLDQPNAKQAYELLGFFAYGGPERPRLDAHPSDDSALSAWFYAPEQDRGKPTPDSVTIRARQIASRTNYLLESMPRDISSRKNEWTSFLWKTAPFISRYQINPNNLAVLAQFKTNDRAEDDILPVLFSPDCKRERIQISHYELLLKIQRYSLAGLAYEVRSPERGNRPKTCHFILSHSDACATKGTPIEVGTVVQLSIPVNAPAGWVSLHIFGQYMNSSEGLDLTYRFFHQPEFQCTR